MSQKNKLQESKVTSGAQIGNQTVNMKLNEKQQQSYERLKQRWDIVSEPHPMLGWHDSAIVMVESKETGAKMTIGIEPDGSTHS